MPVLNKFLGHAPTLSLHVIFAKPKPLSEKSPHPEPVDKCDIRREQDAVDQLAWV